MYHLHDQGSISGSCYFDPDTLPQSFVAVLVDGLNCLIALTKSELVIEYPNHHGRKHDSITNNSNDCGVVYAWLFVPLKFYIL